MPRRYGRARRNAPGQCTGPPHRGRAQVSAAFQPSSRPRPNASSCSRSASICASSRRSRGSSASAFGGSVVSSGGRGSAASARFRASGRQHAQRALEHRHVLFADLLELAEREHAEGGAQIAAHLLLVAGEGFHRLLQIAGHEELHIVAIEADQLAQKADRQQVLPLLLLLDDDLGQHRAGQILAGLGVLDDEIAALFDHAGEVVERHVAAGRRVVEAAVGVFLDDDRLGCRPVCRWWDRSSWPPPAKDAAAHNSAIRAVRVINRVPAGGRQFPAYPCWQGILRRSGRRRPEIPSNAGLCSEFPEPRSAKF